MEKSSYVCEILKPSITVRLIRVSSTVHYDLVRCKCIWNVAFLMSRGAVVILNDGVNKMMNEHLRDRWH